MHSTVVEAVECAGKLGYKRSVVAIENGRVDRLNELEQRAYDIASAKIPKTQRECFDSLYECYLADKSDAERDLLFSQFKQQGRIVARYKNQYKCPFGAKDCGENAIYCVRCNGHYEMFMRILNDDR